MDDALCLWTLNTIRIYMGHYIMTYLLLSLLSNIIIDIVSLGFQLLNLLLCDSRIAVFIQKTKFILCLSKRNP